MEEVRMRKGERKSREERGEVRRGDLNKEEAGR
jgi:hypothetical protein